MKNKKASRVLRGLFLFKQCCVGRSLTLPVNELVGKSRCEHVCRDGAKLLTKAKYSEIIEL